MHMQFVKEIFPTPHHAGDFDMFVYKNKAYIVFENPHSELVVRELSDDYTDLTEDLPDMNDVFYKLCGPNRQKMDLTQFSDENTSLATYVWLPICFDENEKPYIRWQRTWSL